MSKKWSVLSIVALTLLSTTLLLWAQETAAPKVLTIEREEIKPGTQSQHERVAQGYVEIAGQAKSTTHWIGMDPLSGNENVALFLAASDSFAAMEKERELEAAGMGAHRSELEKLDREASAVHTSQTSVLAVLRADLSYRLGDITLKSIGQSRYFEVETYRLRPGSDMYFAVGAKMYFDVMAKANVTRPVAVYQVVAGAPKGTYIILKMFHSLSELDVNNAKAIMQAIGEEGMKKFEEGERNVVMSTESNFYAINPAMSYVLKDVAAASPEFWTPKPAAKPTAAASAKEAKKK